MVVRFGIAQEEMISRERFFENEILPELGSYKPGKRQALRRETELHDIFFWLSLIHFGIRPSVNPVEVLKRGRDLVDQFFFSEWWKSHKLDMIAMTRSEENSELQWFKPYRTAMLLASIQGERPLITKLAGWPASWMIAEWRAVEFPVGIEQLYFQMLNVLGLADLQVRLDRIEDRRIRTLAEAVASSDCDRLARTICETIPEFAKGLPRQGLLPYQAVAIEETIIVYLWQTYQDVDLRQNLNDKVKPYILALPTFAG